MGLKNEALNKATRTRLGGLALTLVSVAVIAWGLVSVWSFVSGPTQPGVWYIDTATNKAFRHVPTEQDEWLVEAPSGTKTGQPAELCWWKTDGSIRDEPFPVLLNADPAKSGPTFCADCGRLVVPQNPGPGLDRKPPPTKAEYDKLPRRR